MSPVNQPRESSSTRPLASRRRPLPTGPLPRSSIPELPPPPDLLLSPPLLVFPRLCQELPAPPPRIVVVRLSRASSASQALPLAVDGGFAFQECPGHDLFFHSTPDVFKNRIHLLRDGNTTDFDAWVSLTSAVEETSADDIEIISLVYRSFLLEFPLCYGYWIKYAAHKAWLCTYEDVVEVYEQAVQAVPHSVDLWVSYCGFGISAYEDPGLIRSLFDRAVSLVGKDYFCHHLWDKYIEFETSQKQLIQLATVYINTLKFPTKKLDQYYESFKKLVTSLEQEATLCGAKISSENVHTSEVIEAEESDGYISAKVAALFDQGGYLKPKALKQYLFAGQHLYQRSNKINKEICGFEACIKRPFFHVKPLDDDQLENWNLYLDFVEKNGDFDWAVKLYERCLIPCANYSEFWIRYVEYVDAKGGREIANYALSRASSCFVKGVPTFSMYYAMFKEQIGDAPGARALFVKGSINFTPDLNMHINRLANMERRMGNTKAATEIYENAIEDAMQKQNIEILPDLYTSFAQFKYMASRSIGEAKEIFVKGINQAPCKPLIEGFIQFMSTYGGPTEIPLLDSVISNAVTPGSDVSTALSPEDREDISLLFLKFVDLYGGVQELRKAWARHSKLFPHNTRNLLQSYSTTDNNKKRITESLRVPHDHTPEGTDTLKQSSKSDTCSWLVDKEAGSSVNLNTVGSGKGQRDADEQSIVGSVDAHQEVGDTAQECIDMANSQNSLYKHETQNQTNWHANQENRHELTSCEQNEQTTNSHPSASEKAPVAESCNFYSPSKSIVDPKQIDALDEVKTIERSAIDHPGTVCSRSDSPSGASLLKEGIPSEPAGICPELEEKQHEKIQVKLETYHVVSVSNAKPEKSSDSPEATQCGREVSALSQDHIQSSQTQEVPDCAKPSSSEMATTQTDTCTQFSPNNAVSAQAQLQHQIDNSQMYQSNNLPLAGQNTQQIQPQGSAYAIPQNVQTSSQIQLHAQPNQGDQEYLQMMQGYASQMWQYYQQQLYYLQTQHNQQMQSLQQQQLPTEHLQQNFMQQVQQLNQQMVLWQQQVQQQHQQQAQPAQQQSENTQGQYHPSSGDTKQEQNKHQQQESQMDHQSQQFQQQQQLLYFQQQQQMYLMQQQQQMYQQQQQQQQQLMQQQQYLSQMPQQKQDVVQQQQLFQQQQQQLFEQQQKQMVLLQQQQQQYVQQQMQQYLQQQANQQGFKDQNCELNHQDARKRQMEHVQQSEASQSDGSKLRNGEQSELSYPSTPQSQHSNY